VTVTNRHIDPILAESTPGGFLRSARLLPEGTDWTGGITFTPSCGGSAIWSCAYGEEKSNISDKESPVEFDPFLVYAGTTCSGAPDFDDLRQLSQIKLLRGMSGSLARELQSSNVLVGNPDLVTTAIDITPSGGPTAVTNAIAGLMSAAQDCGGGGELTFHIPLVALAGLMRHTLVEFIDGRYRIGGHTVIVDAYDNIGPTGSTLPSENEAWLYVTGPVEYRLGENIDVAHFTGRTNEGIVLAEQLAILRFDPCCVHAILAEIC
jgi:hypothetical protein